MLITTKSMNEIKLKTLLCKKFDMKDLGVVKKILGMEICADRTSGRLWLYQRICAEGVLEF